MYLANTERPDMAFACSLLSRYMTNPGIEHWKCALHVVRYLSRTMRSGIIFQSSSKYELLGYADTSYAACRETRKSSSGYAFTGNGSSVSWRSRKQNNAAQSTLEAEYISLSYAARERIWLRRLHREFCPSISDQATKKFCTNYRANSLPKNETTDERTQNIQIRYQFIREHVSQPTIRLRYLSIARMVPDIF